MVMPRWLARVNKHVFNPIEVKRGARPVLTHVGRKSGTTYRTPMDAHRLPGGFVFIPMYGPKTDWVNNALAAEGARLTIRDEEWELVNPRLVKKSDVWQMLPATTKTPPGISDESDLLRMDLSQ